MQPALADFRIESDRVVYLAFADGRRYRVSPNDLERLLRQEDVHRVRQALQLRRQFMRRILPPMAVVLVAAGIIGFGSYDMIRVSHGWLAPPVAAPQQQVQKATSPQGSAQPGSASRATAPVSTPAPASPSSPTAPATAATAAQSDAPPQPVDRHQTQSIDSGDSPALPVAPLASPSPSVPQLLAPVAEPVNGVIDQLSKLLR